MKIHFLAVFILIVLLSLPQTSFASCAVKPSVDDAARGASLIFVGTVTKITPAQIASASYSILAKKPKWEMDVGKVDLVAFSVSEAFKGVSSETIEIATSVDGDAGYKFEGSTWLKVGQPYLVYAYERAPAGTIPTDLTKENYGDVAAELLAIHKAFPKKLAAEINEFNSKISPYHAHVCGRTTHISDAAEELEQIRKIFPKQSALMPRPMPNSSLQGTRRGRACHQSFLCTCCAISRRAPEVKRYAASCFAHGNS